MKKTLCLVCFLGIIGSGCARTVILKSPYNAEKVTVTNEGSPKFIWAPSETVWYGHRVEYTLQIARTEDFETDTVATVEGLKTNLNHALTPEEGFLPGGQTYFWQVTGIVNTTEGDLVSTMLCENPRSFFMEKREVVAIDVKVPAGENITQAMVKIGDEEFPGNFSIEMENGEIRPIAISFKTGEEDVSVGGEISIVGVNENTKFGKIIVDNLTPEDLTGLSTGGVWNYSYKLGGTDIVKVTLGSRTSR